MGAYDTGSINQLVSANYALITAINEASKESTQATASLVKALTDASGDSTTMARKIFWLTVAIIGVGILQAAATAWPYLAWWWRR
jgi:hypothetical protein